MHTILTATEINRLAQRLTQPPLGRSASVAAAAERFQRLLAAKIGPARAAEAARAILAAPGFETAEGRLVAEIEADAAAIPVEPAPAADPEPVVIAKSKAAPKPESTSAPNAQRRHRNADLDARARQGELPPPPDFSAPTHARFRSKLEGLTALAERGDAEALAAVTINPVSSSPKALARYRDLCLTAIEARKKV
ncbi:MAG: hypothetical protein INF52_12715 [Rhodobacter sp.]|jgi:hypothetical protein|nr:hypothetical protein [Rhodobacter sp.]